MKFHSTKSYQETVFQLIKADHKFNKRVTLNHEKKPIIGFGFDLTNTQILQCVFKSLGFDTAREVLTDEALDAELCYMNTIRTIISMIEKTGIEIACSNIETTMLERLHDQHYLNYPDFKPNKEFCFHDAHQAKLAIKLIMGLSEHALDYWLIAGNEEMVASSPALFIRDKKERIALLSMVLRGAIGFQRSGDRLLPELHQALLEKNRAEVWFQIRYKSNPTNAIAAKRAYFESELFALYDQDILSQRDFREQCKSIYRMYNESRDEIMAYEKQNAPLINQANIEFRLFGDNKIKTIEQSFQPAYDSIRSSQGFKPLSSIQLNNDQLNNEMLGSVA